MSIVISCARVEIDHAMRILHVHRVDVVTYLMPVITNYTVQVSVPLEYFINLNTYRGYISRVFITLAVK